METTFANEFLKVYDRLIAEGGITFARTGINKEEFTNLCIDPGFVLEEERFQLIADRMGLDDDTRARLEELADFD
ncbi:MAG: hypothetical protein PUB39_06260 [Eubacteriales bacterium]|nr:hypothetical protein [Eubacteriales bacterium]